MKPEGNLEMLNRIFRPSRVGQSLEIALRVATGFLMTFAAGLILIQIEVRLIASGF